MPTEADPIVGSWYCQLDKGKRFRVTAIEETDRTVETQDFEGTLDEYDLDIWYQMNLEPCAAPASWAGAEDIGDTDDYGTQITDTRGPDWNEPADDFAPEIPHRK